MVFVYRNEREMKSWETEISIFILIGVLFLSVSSVFPETAKEYFNRGKAYFKQSNFTESIPYFTKAIKINPKYAEAYINRGNAYEHQGNFTQAIPDYTKAIEINPNFAMAYNNRGGTYWAMKEYDKAWTDVHKAEELGYAVNPKFLNALKKTSGRDK